MKYLFLDDEPVRHEVFAVRFSQHEVWHAYNLPQFLKALDKGGKFDAISFDHDLGPEATGHDCAVQMLERLPHSQWPGTCIVHSWNPVGAERIVRTLSAAGINVVRLPFGQREFL